MSGFTVKGKAVPDSYVCPNIFAFCAFMAAAVASRRGGKASAYIRECYDFMKEVVGKALSIADTLPSDYDWSLSAARDSADEMMIYDGD